MAQEFTGQTLIAIGGTSGIGKTAARLVLEKGGSAVLIGSCEEKLQTAVTELSQYGVVTGQQANISNPDEREALIERLSRDHADATLLVNSAGFFLPKSFLEHSESDYDLYFDLNKATFFITQAIVKTMVNRGQKGAIVNVGSMWAKQAIQATPSSA